MKKSLLLVMLAALAFASCKKPTANFSASKTDLLVGEVVTFTNTSEDATHYIWDFGDGSTHSTAKGPTHVYWVPGSYTVTLTTYSKSFKDYEEATTIITVAYDDDDQFQEDQKETVESIVGMWDYDKYEYVRTINGTKDPTASFILSFSKSTFEFLEEGINIYSDEDGNELLMSWSVIDEDRVSFQAPHGVSLFCASTIYTIAVLGTTSFVLTQVCIYEDIVDDTIEETRIYSMSM